MHPEIKEIVDFVDVYRKVYGVRPTPGYKPEPSCFAFGEGHNLLYSQLIKTNNDDGSWSEINDPEVRGLVLRVVRWESVNDERIKREFEARSLKE